ncbi:MAG: hypothetical protein ACFCUQ_12810 [Kiloniellales bacterium]
MSKPAATLTSSLLALKGRASTAGFRPPPEPSVAPPAAVSASATTGAAEPLLKARPPSPEARRKEPKAAKAPRAAASVGGGNGANAADTVRLSYRMAPSEHRRFALLAAHLGKSKQQLIDEALAAYMARCGSEVAGGTCACLAGAVAGEAQAMSLSAARTGPASAVAGVPESGGPAAIAAAGEME